MTVINLTRRVTAVLAALFLTFTLAACEDKGSTEQTGDATEGTTEQTAETPEEGAQKLEESAE